ncbi:hypothetical protein DFJ73DRAFT_827229 [Zopfochytrium polystomum]|nr:hypothetical protein DFJ73DRAFT_827229 [Zopfochytrium polystomum]
MGASHSFFSSEGRAELLSRPVGTCLLLNRPLCKLDPTESVYDAMRKLKRHNISALPICTSNLEFVLVDMVDIAAFLSNCHRTIGEKAFVSEAERILSVNCSQIADFSTYNPTLSVKLSTPVEDVIRRMRRTKTHRMVLVDDNDEIHHMVTQSSLVEFFLLNLDKLHPRPDATLRDLGFFGSSPVLYCDESEIVIEVFKTMHRAPISALPMRSQAAVTGILTMRDVKWLNSETLSDLLLPVKDFLKKHRPSHIMGSVTMTLRDLLRSMVVNLFHHMFFVNDAGVPTHVITLTDILDFIVPSD